MARARKTKPETTTKTAVSEPVQTELFKEMVIVKPKYKRKPYTKPAPGQVSGSEKKDKFITTVVGETEKENLIKAINRLNKKNKCCIGMSDFIKMSINDTLKQNGIRFQLGRSFSSIES